MRVHLKALGCRLNEAELEQWGQALLLAGHDLTESATSADVLIINTCAVTAEAVRKSRQSINRLHRDNPEARLVVTGCYASLSKAAVQATLGVDLVLDNADKDQLVQRVGAAFDMPVQPRRATEPGANALFRRGRQRAFVKVQDGCRFQCAYCIVTVARGQERSRPVADIVREVQALHQSGVQEVVITGVQVGGYGHGAAATLSGLLRTLLAETDIPRLRVGSLEPWAVDQALTELLRHPRFMPHLHLPLQSGSDTVLRRMARRTRVAAYQVMVRRLRDVQPALNLTTDIIVGFPGETDAEWRQTLDTVTAIEFGHIHGFSYSDRAGTKAARLPGKVPGPIKRARSRELHALAAAQRTQRLRQAVGSDAQVLWEGVHQGHAAGYTEHYLRVVMPAGTALENTLSPCRLVAVSDDGTHLLAEAKG